MNENLKSALIHYIYEGKESILVTGDKKIMEILKSYPEGVQPTPEEVQAKYEALMKQEPPVTTTNLEELPPLVPEGQSGSNIVESPSALIENARKRGMAKALTLTNPDMPAAASKKLNEVGYANIVLMSIIVMIIVAIICVFIFL